MALRSLVPWTRNRPVPAPFSGQELSPFVSLRQGNEPVHVVAELPGMTEKDVETTFADSILTLEGEKKAETTSPALHGAVAGQVRPLRDHRFRGRSRQGAGLFQERYSDLKILQKRPAAQSKVRKITVKCHLIHYSFWNA